MNLSAALLRFRSGSKLIWRGLATCFFSLSHPCPQHLTQWTCPREDIPSVGHLEVSGLLSDVGDEPLVIAWGYTSAVHLRPCSGKTHTSRTASLPILIGCRICAFGWEKWCNPRRIAWNINIMYPGSIFYVSFYIIWTFVMGLLLCRRLWLHIPRFTFAEHDRVLNWDGETTPSRQ